MKSTKQPPGVMLYLEDLDPIKQLSKEDQGSLFVAILEYGKDGTLPHFEGMLAITWLFILPRIKRDIAKYNYRVSTKRYGTYCREAARRGEIPVSHELWDQLSEHQQKQLISGDVMTYPTTDPTAPPPTNTTPSLSTSASASTSDHRCSHVSLSPYQYDTLRAKMDEDTLCRYLTRLSSRLSEGQLSDSNHYLTILEWWHRDQQY